MATQTCKWCGKRYEKGFLRSNKIGLKFETGYCSKQCASQDNGNQSTGNGNQEDSTMSAKEKAEIELEKKKLELEERKLEEEKEAKAASDRKEKGAKYRADGKPLTAFLVELNPIYLLAGIVVYSCLFFIEMYGIEDILIKGGIALIGVAFLAFVIKDFAKLKGNSATITIVGLLLIPIAITSWKVYDKSKTHSRFDETILSLQKASLQNTGANTAAANNVTKPTENTENKTENKTETAEQPENRSDNQILVENLNNKLKGAWKGDFGGKELLIDIAEIGLDLGVTGHDEVKGNKRDLKGVIKDNGNNNFTINLKEPGDDKWDGVFDITYENNTLTGVWKSNNGKSTKNFTLAKK